LTLATQPTSSRSDLRRLLLYVIAFFVIWTIRAFALAPLDQAQWPFLVRRLYLDGLRFLLWVLPVLLYLRHVDRVDVLKSLKLTTPIDREGLLRGTILSAAYLFFSILVGSWLNGKAIHSPLDLTARRWLELMVMFLFAPFAEELLFRGFLLTKAMDLSGFWTANLMTAALFALIHWPGWLSSGNWRDGIIMMSLSVFALGLLLGYLVKITGSLWPAVAVHVCNNVLVTVFA
jgi:membrane protease YdiL (CAAX protease family)